MEAGKDSSRAPGVREMFITRIYIYIYIHTHNNGTLKLLILGLWDFKGCRG